MYKLICNRIKIHFSLAFLLIIFFTSCHALLNAPTEKEISTLGEVTPYTKKLKSLPHPNEKVVVAVYKFKDQTGQYKPSEFNANWSTAVPQGTTSILLKALEDSKWFTTIERENISDLLNERQIIKSTRQEYATYQTTEDNKTNTKMLPPLLFAGIILEGGIVSYDSNIMTGGAGARYFWQVVASDGINEKVFSSTNKFTTSAIPPNRIHFVRLLGDNHVIYSTDEAGDNFKFTQESVNSLRPRKNNSAGLVSFMRMVEGNMHLFTAKLDGSNIFKVTKIPVTGFNNNEIDYAWSANGSEFIYPNYNKLYRINKDGSGTQLVYTTNDNSYITECAWSNDGSKIVLKTNNIDGYSVKIFIIDLMGNTIKTILENVTGAAGGLDISVDGSKILYARDISGFESSNYRQLRTHLFIYNLNTDTVEDISDLSEIPNGFIDVDPRFSPNEAEVIFTQTSNDGISRKDIYKISLSADDQGNFKRTLLFENAWMPDWE